MARPRHRLFVAVVAAFALLTGATPATAAEPAGPQRLVADYLRAHPGGTQINATQISYGDGAFIVTVARPARALAAADCPSGWFCFYDRINFGYPRGQLSSCGWQDLATWSWQNRTESVHYNMSVGSVRFLNHGGTNHSGDTALFSVSSSSRTRADVAPYRNQADHVYRYC